MIPPWTPGPSAQPSSRWQPLPVTLAVVTSTVLVGTLVAAVVADDEDPDLRNWAGATTPTTADQPFDPAAPQPAEWVLDPDPDLELPDQWDRRVVDLVTFVEEERGLEFVSPVPVDFLEEEEFLEELGTGEDDPVDEDTREEMEDLQDQLPMLRALGWMEGDLDLIQVVDEYQGAVTAAFYDSEERRVVVPTTDPQPLDNATLVHELTHALQDQYFDLDSLIAEADDDNEDDSGADEEPDPWVTPVVEGDALRVQRAWMFSQDPSTQEAMIEQNNAEVDAAQADVEGFPTFLAATFYSPYRLGQPLVDLLHQHGGNERVNQAFMELPTTGSQLLDPRTYLDGTRFDSVEAPVIPATAEEMDGGEFDAWDLYMLLAQRVSFRSALNAADGWGAGSYSAYERNGEVCVDIRVTALTDDDHQQLVDVLQEWVDGAPRRSGAELDRNPRDAEEDVVGVRTCDPGQNAELRRDRLDNALEVIAFRSQATADFMALPGSDVDMAWDTAECMTSGILDADNVSFEDAYEQEPSMAMAAVLMDCGLM